MTLADATFDRDRYYKQIPHLWTSTLRKLTRCIRSYGLLTLFFLAITITEIIVFFVFFTFLSQSTLLAFTLAIFFLTIFSYFVLRLYFQAKKPEHLMDLREEYFNQCKAIIHYQEGIPEHHIALASAAQKLATALHEKEYTYWSPPFFLKSLAPTLEKFSCFCYWKDIFCMKELLLNATIEEYLKVVKCEPTNLEVHAALANAYVMLSGLYADPSKYQDCDEEKWYPSERYSDKMKAKFRKTSERAIEEFKILNDYAPNDPWVHVQLAYSYHDLQMPEEEIREYETMLKLRPNDNETLFKLGMLYFQQGMNAKGLRAYQMLKQTLYKKAESLIKFYGS